MECQESWGVLLLLLFFNLRVNMTRHVMLRAGLEFFFPVPKKELIIRA